MRGFGVMVTKVFIPSDVSLVLREQSVGFWRSIRVIPKVVCMIAT